MREFVIARCRDQHGTLPYVLCVPLEEGPLWLRAREAWPRGARVYCHQLSNPPELATLDIIQRVGAAVCKRRGNAIDLVLQRKTNKRSQFVFTSSRGRPLIFWQTSIAAKSAKPGLRIPPTSSDRECTFYIDSRERYGYAFKAHRARVERCTLPVGDYAAMSGEKIIAAVERKTLIDFTRSIVEGSLGFAMAELAGLPHAAIAVEARYSELMSFKYVRAGFIPQLIGRLQIRYPAVAICFLETRKIAEEWTYRFLLSAYQDNAKLPLLGESEPE